MRQEEDYLAATMDSIDNVRAELSKWTGSGAILWSYTVSHSVLTIRLQKQGAKGNLHVECLDVSSFSGPVSGPGTNFIIEETTRPRWRGPGRLPTLHLKDIGELGISIYCDFIVLKKNVAPVY